ncbi:hypothetical protein SAMN05421678_115159 [Actinopolymorpha cephalotaxi]|uniref:Uncharacterized protein n=1 Tax=Actinopolymorpha cephalotaxi TaxID=504797 RepID=A0A1I2Z3E4_9ACTN|nr:hypothetical protein [Actinopolymorpha cephalotaxi]NYH81840.1 hypothetical protein [Actinopolymorpha cephalotaxi]SFH32373.1 hypothetical protein SAMN05421678_115159 [Actinopolymorpha cephalotaxi]
MATATETPVPESVATGERSHRMVWPFVAALLAAVVVVAGWYAYARSYAPLHVDSYAGTKSGSVTLESDDWGASRFVLHGHQGQRGEVAYMLRNDGRHAVRLSGLAPYDSADTTLLAAGWTPFLTANRVGGGLRSDLRNFPVTIRPGEAVNVWLTAVRPKCGPGITVTFWTVRLRWSALGVEHRDQIPLGQVPEEETYEQTAIPIQVCGPRS